VCLPVPTAQTKPNFRVSEGVDAKSRRAGCRESGRELNLNKPSNQLKPKGMSCHRKTSFTTTSTGMACGARSADGLTAATRNHADRNGRAGARGGDAGACVQKAGSAVSRFVPQASDRIVRGHPVAPRCRRFRGRVQRRSRAAGAQRHRQQRAVGSERLHAGNQHQHPRRGVRQAGSVCTRSNRPPVDDARDGRWAKREPQVA